MIVSSLRGTGKNVVAFGGSVFKVCYVSSVIVLSVRYGDVVLSVGIDCCGILQSISSLTVLSLQLNSDETFHG